ncbi:hypothetical protein EST38_g7729 [Candolleomyces aberdarensis]|uniref:DUF6533 domain-containing protein n=1 Tax=Candolleomyces aberdarensis TaxID=2316362 RepID=A0A4Q2DEY1_9AGAR|nr:hypothetical protein EST38_g7729 [Candolleomyces aberdarensis]
MAIKDLCEIDLLHSIINTCGQKLRAILEAYVFQSDLFLWIQQVNGWLATSDNSQEVKRIRECVIIKAAMDITNVRNVNASSSFRGLGKSSLVSIGRQAPQVSVESYLNNVAGTQVVGYNCVASLAFLIYDILLTLHQEVRIYTFIFETISLTSFARLRWYGRESLSAILNFIVLNALDSISWNLTKCLFFFIRYFPVILQISVLFVGTPPFTFTKRECYIWNVYQGLATVLIVAAVDYILILRIFALYSRSRIIRYLVATLYLLELVTMSIGVGLAVPNLGYDDLCTLIDVPDTFLIAAGAPIAFQTILFGLTAWRFLEAVKAGWGNVPIIQLLMRDGTWAFILLFAILLGEAFLYGFAPEAYTDVLYGYALAHQSHDYSNSIVKRLL